MCLHVPPQLNTMRSSSQRRNPSSAARSTNTFPILINPQHNSSSIQEHDSPKTKVRKEPCGKSSLTPATVTRRNSTCPPPITTYTITFSRKSTKKLQAGHHQVVADVADGRNRHKAGEQQGCWEERPRLTNSVRERWHSFLAQVKKRARERWRESELGRGQHQELSKGSMTGNSVRSCTWSQTVGKSSSNPNISSTCNTACPSSAQPSHRN